MIPRNLGEDAKKERDRLTLAVDEIRRFVSTNLRARTGVLKDASALTGAQKRYQAGAGVINQMASTSAALTRIC